MTTFASNLKRARVRRRLSAPEAASLCNVAKSTWFAYESGRETPTLRKLLRIAHDLGTDASRLLRGVEWSAEPVSTDTGDSASGNT